MIYNYKFIKIVIFTNLYSKKILVYLNDEFIKNINKNDASIYS